MTESNKDITESDTDNDMMEYALSSSIKYEEHKKQLLKAQAKYRLANKDTLKFKQRANKASRKFYKTHREYWQEYYRKKKAIGNNNVTTSDLLDR